MTTRTRIGITLASALVLGVTHYGQAMTIVSQGPDHSLWRWAVIAGYALAIVAVAVVDRWWALLPAAVPMAVSFYLYNLTDYSTPWDSESLGNPGEPVTYAFLLLFATALQMAALSIGLIPRRVWRLVRGRTWSISQG
jgi:K+-sensing histidine kinase KdpD